MSEDLLTVQERYPTDKDRAFVKPGDRIRKRMREGNAVGRKVGGETLWLSDGSLGTVEKVVFYPGNGWEPRWQEFADEPFFDEGSLCAHMIWDVGEVPQMILAEDEGKVPGWERVHE